MYDDMSSYTANRCIKIIADLEQHPYVLTHRMMYAGGYVYEVKNTLDNLENYGAITAAKRDEYKEKVTKIYGDNKMLASVKGFLTRTRKSIYKEFTTNR